MSTRLTNWSSRARRAADRTIRKVLLDALLRGDPPRLAAEVLEAVLLGLFQIGHRQFAKLGPQPFSQLCAFDGQVLPVGVKRIPYFTIEGGGVSQP